jgi:hypothetical protein
MKLPRTIHFVLVAVLAIASFGLTAYAQEPQSNPVNSLQDLNLSNAQVLQIQAMLFEQARETQSLNINLQAAQASLSKAIAQGDPVLTAMAVLSLDAAEKALKVTQVSGQRNLLALLNEAQKQTLEDSSKKTNPETLPASE